jgi:hypothetical protein
MSSTKRKQTKAKVTKSTKRARKPLATYERPPRPLTENEEAILMACYHDRYHKLDHGGIVPDRLDTELAEEMSDEELKEALKWLMDNDYIELGNPKKVLVYRWTPKAMWTYSFVEPDFEDGFPGAIDCLV